MWVGGEVGVEMSGGKVCWQPAKLFKTFTGTGCSVSLHGGGEPFAFDDHHTVGRGEGNCNMRLVILCGDGHT